MVDVSRRGFFKKATGLPSVAVGVAVTANLPFRPIKRAQAEVPEGIVATMRASACTVRLIDSELVTFQWGRGEDGD